MASGEAKRSEEVGARCSDDPSDDPKRRILHLLPPLLHHCRAGEGLQRAVTSIPAPKVHLFMEEKRKDAAIRMQSWWKGVKGRRTTKEAEDSWRKRDQAARVLQKWWRQKRMEWKKGAPEYNERRVELRLVWKAIGKIRSWERRNRVPKLTADALAKLDYTARWEWAYFVHEKPCRKRRDRELKAHVAAMEFALQDMYEGGVHMEGWGEMGEWAKMRPERWRVEATRAHENAMMGMYDSEDEDDEEEDWDFS